MREFYKSSGRLSKRRDSGPATSGQRQGDTVVRVSSAPVITQRMALYVALAAVLLLPPLYRTGLSATAVYNGDEAIYVQMAREMVQSGHIAELTFDGERLYPRPPAAIWVLAGAYRILGADPVEPPLRLVNALLCAIAVALTVMLGARLFSPLVGILAGVLLATADLFVGYARLYESEPLLVCFVLGAFFAWSDPRARRSSLVVYAVCLGGALLTKQFVGFLPLLAPIVETLAAKRGTAARHSARQIAFAVLLGLAVATPWHLYMIARHGGEFVDSFFVHSLIGRAGVGLLHRTSASYYVHELWFSERWPFAILFLVASFAALVSGLWRGREPDLLVGSWAVGVLGAYSVARSRYDYYLVLAYPAFTLAAACTLVKLPLGTAAKRFAITAVLFGSAITHLPRNLDVRTGDDETRQLLLGARGVAPRLPIYTFNSHPFSARVYGQGAVHVFVELERDIAAARALRATGMPAPALLAAPPLAALSIAQRPSLLLWPRARIAELGKAPASSYRILAETTYLRLMLLP